LITLFHTLICFGGEPFAEFSDRFFLDRMGSAHLPGVVLSVVKDGKIVLSRGYGLSNLYLNTPMSGSDSVVRVASNSKLFTATAVMQQVEQGRLSLDTDVNAYLKGFQLEKTFPEPVRLRNLLTHSAGLEERFIGLLAPTPERFMELDSYLGLRMPKRILPPGEVTSYSNHGFALAGLLVQQVSGMPFAQYMQSKVLAPLRMNHSSFELTPELRPHLATGYVWNSDQFSAEPYDYLETVPASSLLATADDMAHFMIAQLDLGDFEGRHLITPQSARLMQTREFTNHPELPGFGFGFFEWYRNGVRALTHGGEARGFNSLFCIFPGTRTGFFLSYNRFGSDVAEDYFKAFVDRFFPKSENPPQRQLAFSEPGSISGTFRMNRYPRSDFTKLSSLLGGFAQEVRVRSNWDGSIAMIPLPWARERETVWHPAGPLVYENRETGEKLAFRADASGAITHLFRGSRPEGAFDPIPWYESTTLHLCITGLALLIFILNLFFLRSQRLFAAVGLGYLAFVALGGLVFHLVPPIEVAYGIPEPVRLWLGVPYLCAGLLGAGLIYFLLRWRKTAHRALISIQLGAGVCFEAVLLYWHFF
jgi:CubicO group peptidase (beta-lactamase class C family)